MRIRCPLSVDEQYQWHTAALAGRAPPIHFNDPHCGWFRRKLVKGGPKVPAVIWLHQSVDEVTGELCAPSYFCCDVNAEPRDPYEEWEWLCGDPIPKSEFDHLTRLTAYARTHDHREPLANPRKALDLFSMPVPEFTQRKARR